MMHKSYRFAFAAVLALILSGCGSASSGPSTSINVTMTDFSFTPNVFTVPAGKPISFSATNNGAVAHSFVIMQLGHEVQAHFGQADQANVFWEQQEVQPGASAQATFTAPTQPGTYQVVCANAGHFEAGMVAKLVVVASQ